MMSLVVVKADLGRQRKSVPLGIAVVIEPVPPGLTV